MFASSYVGRTLSRPPTSPLIAIGFLLTVLVSMVGVVAVFQVTQMTVGTTGAPCIVASMGASAVILYALPETPAARLWSLFAGHLLSGLVGILATRCVDDRGGAAALAVGGALLVMGLFRCVHPPGGATALTVAVGGPELQELGFLFLLSPLLMNLLALGAITWIFRRLSRLSAHQWAWLGAGRSEYPTEFEASLGAEFGDLAQSSDP